MLSPRPAALDTPAAADQVPATSSHTLYVTSKSRIFLTKAHPCARLPTANCTLVLWPLFAGRLAISFGIAVLEWSWLIPAVPPPSVG
jgi:hypothetical protein